MIQTLSKTMKAVAIDQFGGVETLKTQELPVPAVGAHEVLIHVEAAGVGVWDPFEREGWICERVQYQARVSACSGIRWRRHR